MNPVKLSIVVRTFNVEAYLSECLNGILSQQAEYPFEIIVADDASTDSTLLIAESFVQKHPSLFRVLRSQTNRGLVRNLLRGLHEAKGDYIALCDGDDYWTDKSKIQKQIQFLETHPEFSSCGHRVMIKKEPLGRWEGPIPPTIKSQYNTYDLLDACFPHSSSILFRRQVISDIPSFFTDIYTDDWCITILNSLRGHLRMFPEAMSVYRFSSSGNWTSKKPSFQFDNAVILLDHLKTYLPLRFRCTANKYLLRNLLWCGTHSLSEGDHVKALYCLKRLIHPQTFFVLNRRQVVSFALRTLFPGRYLKLKSLRDGLLRWRP